MNDTAMANVDTVQQLVAGEKPDIQAILRDLEEKLYDSLDILGPTLKSIGSNLVQAASDIREGSDATLLWTSLDNLQHFLDLLEQICSVAGATPSTLGEFDNALGDGLERLEECLNSSCEPEQIAATIEAEVLPAFDMWSKSEAAIREMVEAPTTL